MTNNARIIPIFIPITYKHKIKLFRPKYLYFKYPDREYIREIVKPPESITPILEYAIILRERYNKNVKLTLVKSRGKKEFLRFLREDGIPLYIDMHTCELYIREKDIDNPITPIAVGYFIQSCGYTVKSYTKRSKIERYLPFCVIKYVKEHEIPHGDNK